MGDWPDDAELKDAEARLGAKYGELVSAGVPGLDWTWFPPVAGLETCLSLAPEAIEEAFAALQVGVRELATAPELVNRMAVVKNVVGDDWNGPAAEAFVGRLADIEHIGRVQEGHLLRGLAQMAALFQIAADARRNYLELIEASVGAIDTAMGNEGDRRTKATVMLTLDLAKDLVAIEPGNLLRGGIATLIGVGKNVVDLLWRGDEAEQVVSTYFQEAQKLSDRLERDLGTLQLQMRQDDEDLTLLAERTTLSRPLPSCTDVRSPDFSYGAFWYDDRSPDSFGPRAERARREMAEEEQAQDSEIDRRLRGTA